MSFADPLAFVFAALLAVLVLLYLWEQRRQRVVLPSLLLWEQLRDDRITASRFRPDLLFFLQALALTLLIVGLARPYWQTADSLRSGRRHIVVLDTTASMQAREDNTTRFETARQEALQFVDGLPVGDEVMLVSAGHSVSVLAEWTQDHAATRKALAQAAPVDAGGDLSSALAFADNARQHSDLPADILAFTDVPSSRLPAALRDRVTVFQTGSSDDNIAIDSLQIDQGRFQGHGGAQAQVQVHNYSPREVNALLSVQVDDSVVERHGFSLQPQETKRVLVRGFPRAGRVTARLEPADALAVDNTAYGWIRDVRPLRALLVSKPSALVDDLRKLAPAAQIKLTVIDPRAFTADSAQSADVVIFHRVAPEPPAAVSALYIYPPAQGSTFTSLGEATGLEIIDWNAGHAALHALQPLASMPLARARIITPPDGSEILLRTRTQDREFALAFALDHGAQRLACLTFDLEAEHILHSDSTSLLLLLLNLIDWLAPQGNDLLIARTGDAASLGIVTKPLQVIDPRGHSANVEGPSPTIEPLLAGAYELQGEGTKRLLLANFSDPQESNIARPKGEPATASDTPPVESELPQTAPPAEGFGKWLWLAAAALMIGEWIVAARSQQAAS